MATPTTTAVNNQVYETLGEKWYTAQDDPVALLRAESELRNPWVLATLRAQLAQGSLRVLDVGCGGGFLSNYLAREGLAVTGVDLSLESLRVAQEHDATQTAAYVKADGYNLPFESGSFDAICAMDFLEHVEDPARLIAEIARVLKPGGLFFFHTFNRNPLSGLVVIKGVEWWVKNTPKRLHLYRLFIKPSELNAYLDRAGLETRELLGVKPKILNRGFARGLISRRVPKGFRFEFTRSLMTGYCGWARKAAIS